MAVDDNVKTILTSPPTWTPSHVQECEGWMRNSPLPTLIRHNVYQLGERRGMESHSQWLVGVAFTNCKWNDVTRSLSFAMTHPPHEPVVWRSSQWGDIYVGLVKQELILCVSNLILSLISFPDLGAVGVNVQMC